jgi:hypothetical protein
MHQEKIVLFTHADPFQQQQLNISYKDLERSLKNAILLFGKVTLPGSSILKSDLTYKLVSNAGDLLKQGLIVPDLREEYTTFGNYLEKNKTSFRNSTVGKERAAFLDKYTKNIISFPATKISDHLENNLISSLFYLKLNGNLTIKWSDFSDFIDFIKKPGISDRKVFLEYLNKIAVPNKIVLSATQALYHTLGTFITNSNPIWPQLYSETFEKIGIAQQNSTDKIKQSKEAMSILNKHTFISSIQELNSPNNKKIHTNSLRELQNLSFINDDTLDTLDWSDIITLSKKRVALYARQKLFKANASSHNIDLKSILKDEKKIKCQISRTTNGITIASLLTGSISCINTPTITSAGIALSITGLILTIGDLLIKSELEKRLCSYSVLGELITKTADKNTITDRLTNL